METAARRGALAVTRAPERTSHLHRLAAVPWAAAEPPRPPPTCRGGGGGGARHVEKRAEAGGAGARARLFKGAGAEPGEVAPRPQTQAPADYRDAERAGAGSSESQHAPVSVAGSGCVALAR